MPHLIQFTMRFRSFARDVVGLGAVEALARRDPDRWYPIRDVFLTREIRRQTRSSIRKPMLDVASAIGSGLAYCYGAGVVGDVAEFGLQTGRSSVSLIAGVSTLNREYRNSHPHGTKRMHFFDSFGGLPAPTSGVDLDSPHVVAGIWSEGGLRGLSQRGFERLILRHASNSSGMVSIHSGWFAKTVPPVADVAKFSFIHIDSDLYESAIDALEPLFASGSISPGALLLFDDWNCNHANPDYGERRAFSELCSRFSISTSVWRSYGPFSQGMIIHNYSRT